LDRSSQSAAPWPSSAISPSKTPQSQDSCSQIKAYSDPVSSFLHSKTAAVPSTSRALPILAPIAPPSARRWARATSSRVNSAARAIRPTPAAAREPAVGTPHQRTRTTPIVSTFLRTPPLALAAFLLQCWASSKHLSGVGGFFSSNRLHRLNSLRHSLDASEYHTPRLAALYISTPLHGAGLAS
jgi:hypothetical protein